MDFDHEIQNLNKYIQDILVLLKINNSEKLKFRKFWDYFAQKLKHKQRWAYCFHDGIPFGTNMSLERFHGEIKSRFSKNGSEHQIILFGFSFQIWEFEKQKRINFAFNPKKENMSFRMKKISIQKELARQSGRFGMDSNIISLGRLYQITETLDYPFSIKEGASHILKSQQIGSNVLVSNVRIDQIGGDCSEACELSFFILGICWHTSKCSCKESFVEKIFM